jgi:hypothetical protein
MAYVKLRFSKDAAARLAYIAKDRGKDDVSDTNCFMEVAAQEFAMDRQRAIAPSRNECIHIVQSWSADESKLLTPHEFNAIGKQLVTDLFPDHLFVVRTHTDKGHTHNHIVVNCVNFETGKRIENKKALLYNVRAHSDNLCREHGLSVIEQGADQHNLKLPDKVQQMVRYNRRSYILDLAQKADLARTYATSYQEYSGILAEMKIRTDVQNKNITYFYPGREKGKRGSKLGRLYDKEGLEGSFKRNQEIYAAHPELRDKALQNIGALRDGGMASPPSFRDLLSHMRPTPHAVAKDETYFLRTLRAQELKHSADRQLGATSFPIEEIRRARQTSILDYCRNNRIALSTNAQGKTVLKGREYVSVTESDCVNAKNGTRGGIIDFVAAHRDINFLHAVAHLNSNPRLLALEQYFGEAKRTYTSFYIPKQQRVAWPESGSRMADFLQAFKCNKEVGQRLLIKNQAQVSTEGRIRLFPPESGSFALEFVQSENGRWKRNSEGKATRPFYETIGNNRKGVIFLDPISLLQKLGMRLFDGPKPQHETLALMEPNPDLVHQFIAKNKHLKTLFFVMQIDQKFQGEIDLFQNLRKAYQPLGLKIFSITKEHSIERAMFEQERSDHSPSLSL